MSTFFIFILMTLTLIFLIFRYKKLCFATLLLTMITFVIVGNGILPRFLLEQLESPYQTLIPQWKNSNAIILLGAGDVKLPWNNIIKPNVVAYGRMHEAARLYLLCKQNKKQCNIIISGGDPSKIGESEASVYQHALMNIGVKSTDIILESNSKNTFQNAEFTKHLLKDKNFDSIILVTSAIHMKRSLLYFSHFNIEATPAPADFITAYITTIPIGYNFAMLDFALHEYGGIARYYLYQWMGWNTNSSVQVSNKKK